MTRFHHQLMQVRYPHLQQRDTLKNAHLRIKSNSCKRKLKIAKIFN